MVGDAAPVPTVSRPEGFMWYVVPESAALASVFTKSLLHPIDTFKCRAQVCPASHYYGKGFLKYYSGQWTLGHLYGGLPIKLIFYAPYQSIYMTSYDRSRTYFTVAYGAGDSFDWKARTAVALSSSFVAEGCSAVVRVPMEAVKIRIQATTAANTHQALSDLWTHGLMRVSRLFVPQVLCHDLPYSCLQWITYENVKPRLQAAVSRIFVDDHGTVEERSRLYNIAKMVSSLAVGACSGVVASTLTIPLDVIKTRVIIHASMDGSVPSFFATGRRMVREEGARALWRGGQWRVLWIGSNTAVYFCIFDKLKELL